MFPYISQPSPFPPPLFPLYQSSIPSHILTKYWDRLWGPWMKTWPFGHVPAVSSSSSQHRTLTSANRALGLYLGIKPHGMPIYWISYYSEKGRVQLAFSHLFCWGGGGGWRGRSTSSRGFSESERGREYTPHPQQAGPNIPSWLNVRKKVFIANLCTL